MYNQHKSQLFFLFTKLGSRKKVKGGNVNINDLQTKNINAASMIPGIQNIFYFESSNRTKPTNVFKDYANTRY